MPRETEQQQALQATQTQFLVELITEMVTQLNLETPSLLILILMMFPTLR